MALFYPLTVVSISAGLIAFLMLILKMDPLLIATVTLWFYLISIVSIYLITREALKALRMQQVFLGLIITIGALAVMSLLLLLWLR
ncbi:MAG: hypothetical protein APZ16_06080 [Candidatus Hadarchaeum yellowstonense]|jgi:hypothetical protein|uniref:Uncharacterized protein n=1 Tax=Hadarchaeum yellowstonense TaxID=1776334 RepID=A0A147JUX5_HADYE|nr:MAG: hypothetical protein APZ16_06080 [Candidatus Hadarchaeum yellowstonense]